MSTTAQSPHAIVTNWFEAWNAHDLDTALACLSEDVVLTHTAGDTARLTGRDAVGRLVADLYTAFPDCRLDLRTLLTDDAVAVAEYSFVGVQAEDYHGMRGHGHEVHTPIADVMDLRDGHIVAIRRYEMRPAVPVSSSPAES